MNRVAEVENKAAGVAAHLAEQEARQEYLLENDKVRPPREADNIGIETGCAQDATQDRRRRPAEGSSLVQSIAGELRKYTAIYVVIGKEWHPAVTS